MRLTFGVMISLLTLGVLTARALWPCMAKWPWYPILTIFTGSLLFNIGLHMSKWKCWSYLRQNP